MNLSIRNLFLVTLIAGCGSGGVGGGGNGGGNLGTSDVVQENALANGYPTDMAVTSPFADGFALEGLNKVSSRLQSLDIPTFQDKQDEIVQRLTGTTAADCKFVLKLSTPAPAATCYGPTVDYTGHPDATGPESPAGTLPSGDVGIWSENEGATNQACVAAKINSLVGESQARVDMAIDLVTAMLCIANVTADDQLPEIGQSKDFTFDVDSLDLPLTVGLATFEREEDTADGFASYLSTINAEGTPDGKNLTTDIHLRHVPTSDGNETYEGHLWYTVAGEFGSTGNCGPGGSQLSAFSIVYKKTSATELTYRMQRADYCNSADDPFNTFNELDPDGPWAGNFNDQTFKLDPTKGTGVFSYAWQAGPGDSHARSFLAEINANEDGTVTGCGYFGFGPKVQSADVGQIDGMICNWAGPSNVHTPLPIVQRQCMSLDATSKVFVSDSAHLAITYAPTNSCDSPGGGFAYEIPSGMETDAFTNNLVDLSVLQADITLPAKP